MTANLCLFDFLLKAPSFSKSFTYSFRTNNAVYEYSPFECLPIHDLFCLGLCHVVALCLFMSVQFINTKTLKSVLAGNLFTCLKFDY